MKIYININECINEWISERMNEYIDRKNIVNVVINGNLYTNDWMNE